MLPHPRKTVGMTNALKEVRVGANKANGTKFYKPGKGIDTTIIKHIKPIFVDLCKDGLLKKCLDCKSKIKMRVLMVLYEIDYKKQPMSAIISFH